MVTNESGIAWYAYTKDPSIKVIHLTDTFLTPIKRTRNDVNPYIERDYYAKKRKFDRIQKITGKYKPVWERQDGKCFYCGKPILYDQDKTLVMIDHSKKESIANSAYVHSICTLSDYQYLLLSEDVAFMTPYDVCEMLEHITECGSIVRDPELSEDWRYMKLYEYFGKCVEKKLTLTFKEIERILGFELSDSAKATRQAWYLRKGMHRMADAWIMQGYRLKRLYINKQKATIESEYEDAERIVFPPELMNRKVPLAAKYKAEHFMNALVKEYGLSKEYIMPQSKQQTLE